MQATIYHNHCDRIMHTVSSSRSPASIVVQIRAEWVMSPSLTYTLDTSPNTRPHCQLLLLLFCLAKANIMASSQNFNEVMLVTNPRLKARRSRSVHKNYCVHSYVVIGLRALKVWCSGFHFDHESSKCLAPGTKCTHCMAKSAGQRWPYGHTWICLYATCHGWLSQNWSLHIILDLKCLWYALHTFKPY